MIDTTNLLRIRTPFWRVSSLYKTNINRLKMGLKGTLLDILLYLSCLLVTNFGIQLYFSQNHNINNPVVNPIFWLTKDVFLTAFLCLLSFKTLKEKLNFNFYLVGLLGLLNVLIILIPLVKIGYLHSSYFRTLKNLFVYGFLFSLAFPKLLDVYGDKKLLNSISYSILVSLFVGLFFFLIDIVPSFDKRMYGTYGNPTSMGFSAIAGLAIRFALDQKITVTFLVYCSITCIAILYSGSLAPTLGLFLLFPVAYAHIWSIKIVTNELSNDLKKMGSNLLKLCLLIPSLFMGIALLSEVFYQSELVKRVSCILGGCKTNFLYRSNSISDRFEQQQKFLSELNLSSFLWGNNSIEYTRLDSTLMAFIMAVGILPTLSIIGVFYISFKNIYTVPLVKQAKLNPLLIVLASFLWIVLLLNLTLHHQIEIFPTNVIIFLFIFILAYFDSKSSVNSLKKVESPID